MNIQRITRQSEPTSQQRGARINRPHRGSMHAAIGTLEATLSRRLIDVSVDERRSLSKMGDKSEAFCRQTLSVLAQNPQVVPASLDLAEAQRDMAARFSRSAPATKTATSAT